MSKLILGVLGSGRGSNFRAIADEIASGALHAEVAVVASDVENAGILQLARERGFRAEYVAPGPFKTRMAPDNEAALVRLLQQCGVQWVILAGYLRIVKEPLLNAFPGRILNIHPSLLPAFPGLAAWRQALEARVTETGCTVHHVDAGVDTGPVIAQERVPVLASDTEETLYARIQGAEHRLYPAVLRTLAQQLEAKPTRD
jgi:phosphoribosylglycinamide formyltransferase-1